MTSSRLTLVACLAWIISGLSTSAQETQDAYELTFPAMGTVIAFQAFSDDEKQVDRVFTSARKEVERLVEILSDYGTETETVLLSRPEKVGQWQKVSPELWEVLTVCDEWNRLSSGAFDASVGQLSILWRKARKSKVVPTEQEIEESRQKCGWQHVELDRDSQRIKLKIEGLRLDFGAMGKGYIIDKAYELMKREGLPCALVRASGDLRCGSAPPGRAGWPIEIGRLATDKPASEQASPIAANNDADDKNVVRLFLSDAAVSSSGDLFQFMEIGGVRRSHVLDPRTGVGVPGPRMVTVIAPTSTLADAADTALCVMNDEAALKVAEQLGTIQVRIVTVESSGKVRTNTTRNFGRPRE